MDTPPRPDRLTNRQRWLARLAFFGVIVAFMSLLTIPGWFADRDYKAWERGEKDYPTQGLVWAVIGLLSVVLIIAFFLGAPTLPSH